VHFVEVSFGEIQKRRPAHVDISPHPVHAKEKDREGSQPCERRNKENTPHRPRKIPQEDLRDLYPLALKIGPLQDSEGRPNLRTTIDRGPRSNFLGTNSDSFEAN
jgi:hypothetical protein